MQSQWIMGHGPTYEALNKAGFKMAAEMRGSTLFAAVAKHAPTDEVGMLASLLMDMHENLMKTAEF